MTPSGGGGGTEGQAPEARASENSRCQHRARSGHGAGGWEAGRRPQPARGVLSAPFVAQPEAPVCPSIGADLRPSFPGCQPPLSPSTGKGKLRSGELQGPKGATRPHGSPLLSPEPLFFPILPPSPAPAQETESLSALGPSRTWRCHHLGQSVTGGGTGLTDAHAHLQVSGTSRRHQSSWPARF